MFVAGFSVHMKGNRAWLVGQPQLRFDPICHAHPLFAREHLALGIPYLDVKEWLFKLRDRLGHDVNGAEGFPNIFRSEAAQFPERRLLVLLAGREISGQLRPIIMRRSLRNHGRSLRPTRSRMSTTAAGGWA